MNDWRLSSRTEAYLNALRATESIEAPAEGFVKPIDSNQKATITLIKQNNTIIQLLVKISENLEDCLDTVKDIRKVVAEKSAGTTSGVSDKVLEDLQRGLQKLNLGEVNPKPKQKPAPFYVFKNPAKILEEEKRKLYNEFNSNRSKTVDKQSRPTNSEPNPDNGRPSP